MIHGVSLRGRAVAGTAVEHGEVAWTMAFRLPVFRSFIDEGACFGGNVVALSCFRNRKFFLSFLWKRTFLVEVDLFRNDIAGAQVALQHE
ncbi:hypothetical protein RNI52_16515 [Labrys neptuniae]|uniref:hypothetical protein n=1 Tax=Labrys neptuniae TaxID=376174 RepID=UPI00288EAFFD|nr:hypothetical protein [Labrys neptuniae]MDT3378938.1 hypothetical protein [Labrys neptuniae]